MWHRCLGSSVACVDADFRIFAMLCVATVEADADNR